MTCKNGKQSQRCKNTHDDMTQYEREKQKTKCKSNSPLLCAHYTHEFGWGAAAAIYDVSAEYKMERNEQGTKQLYALYECRMGALDGNTVQYLLLCGGINTLRHRRIRSANKKCFFFLSFISFSSLRISFRKIHTLADMTPLVVSVSSGAHARHRWEGDWRCCRCEQRSQSPRL